MTRLVRIPSLWFAWHWALVLIAVGFLGHPAPAWADPEPTGPWHSEITEYPRLFFGPGDLDDLRDRVTGEPYTTLMNRVRSRSAAGYSSTYPTDDYDVNRENSNADIAKCAAFVALIDEDGAKAEKAASILEVLDTDFGPWSYSRIDNDIHIGEAIHGYVTAFDMLAGTGVIDGERLDAIADRLGLMVANLYTDYFDHLAAWGAINFNNHYIKIASSLAMAGMVLNQRDDAMKWVSFGFTESMARLFNLMLAPGGAYAEGPGYGTYSALQHLPLIMAWDHVVGTDDDLYKRDFCLLGPNCTWSPTTVPNPLDLDALHDNALWYVKIRMPDGQYAPIDDADAYGYFNGLLAGAYDDGVLAWDWRDNPMFPLYSNYINELAVELIAFYDDSVPLTEPEFTHVSDFGSGYTIFRSGWETDASWAMLLAENGGARLWGAGHEHGDNLSVTMHARGQYLLIDPGYDKWDAHAVVNKGEHHNVLTVDGKGPPTPLTVNLGGNDAYILDAEFDTPTPFTSGWSRWRQAEFSRTVFFPDNDYLVVIDHARSDLPRPFGMRWNGLAGGDTGDPFAMEDDGASWEPDGAGVRIHVTSDHDIALSTLVNAHSWTWNVLHSHNTLVVNVPTYTTDAAFISVAMPYVPGDETPRPVTVLDADGAAAVRVDADEPVFALSQGHGEAQSFTAIETGGAAIDTDADSLFVRFIDDVDTGEVYMSADSSTSITGVGSFDASDAGRAYVEWDPSGWMVRFGESGGSLLISDVSLTPGSTSPGMSVTIVSGGIRIECDHEGWAILNVPPTQALVTRAFNW